MTLVAFNSAPVGAQWFILDVMKKGDGPPFRGRPKNIWVALLIDVEPELHCSGHGPGATQSHWLYLGRHKSRDAAWDYAADLLEIRH